MHQFSFYLPANIIVAEHAVTAPHDWQKRLTDHHVLVVTDKGLTSTGIVNNMVASIKRYASSVSVFDDVVAEPPVSSIVLALDFARQCKATFVIGLGGGSSLDTAKLVALLTQSHQTLEEVFGVNNAVGNRLPLVQIPTTAGTGSEVTPIAIVTSDTDEKIGIVSPLLYPDLAILDASLTTGLPASITAMVGVDAMVHAIEAYTSKIKKNPISSALAKEALSLLFHHLPVVIKEPHNLDSRSAMLVGSCLAGMAFANAPVGAVHALAYPIGGLFHVPHGLSNALVLIPVMRFNASEACLDYASLASNLFDQTFTCDQEACTYLIDQLDALIQRLPIAQTLSEVGIQSSDIEKMANDAMKVERLLVNNPRTITLQDCISLYRQAL